MQGSRFRHAHTAGEVLTPFLSTGLFWRASVTPMCALFSAVLDQFRTKR